METSCGPRYVGVVPRPLAISLLCIVALGSLGAGNAANERMPLNVVLRSFEAFPTATRFPMPDECGCIRNDVPATLDVGYGVAIQTERRAADRCAEQLQVLVEAGFEGTRSATVGWCDLTVTAEHDARVPTHWTAPVQRESVDSEEIEVVVRSFRQHGTFIKVPLDTDCGVPAGQGWRRPTTPDAGLYVSVFGSWGEGGPSLLVNLDAGVEGTRTIAFPGCVVTVSTAFDEPFPTHWTAPLPDLGDVAAMWSGDSEELAPIDRVPEPVSTQLSMHPTSRTTPRTP
jgi:hypothetical protein